MAEVRSLPDDLGQLTTATRYQLRFFRRSYRALAMAILMSLIAVAIIADSLYDGKATVTAMHATAADYMVAQLAFLTLGVTVVAAMFGGDAISTDFGSGTGYYALVLPVRRAILLLGRYLAAALIGVAVTMIYFVTVVLLALYFYGSVPGTETLTSFALTILMVLAYTAFAFLLSALFRRPVVSIVVVFLLLLIGFPLVTDGFTVFGVEPWFMLNYGAGAVLQALVAGPHSEQITTDIGRNRTITTWVFNPYVWQGALIMFGYLLASIFGSILIYERKELKG